MATATQWARIRSSEEARLRRGAWYRIVKLTAVEVVLDVNGKPTPFPRQSLEILPERPKQWAVVPHAHHLGSALWRVSQLP